MTTEIMEAFKKGAIGICRNGDKVVYVGEGVFIWSVAAKFLNGNRRGMSNYWKPSGSYWEDHTNHPHDIVAIEEEMYDN